MKSDVLDKVNFIDANHSKIESRISFRVWIRFVMSLNFVNATSCNWLFRILVAQQSNASERQSTAPATNAFWASLNQSFTQDNVVEWYTFFGSSSYKCLFERLLGSECSATNAFWAWRFCSTNFILLGVKRKLQIYESSFKCIAPWNVVSDFVTLMKALNRFSFLNSRTTLV